jgi:hypothetical protein
MRKLLLLTFLATASISCFAQSPVTVTGTVYDNTGHLATSGFVQFTLSPASQSLLYYVTGIGLIAPQNTSCAINASGLIKDFINLANPCQVWGNDVISPGNTTYVVALAPGGTITQTIRQLQISASCTNLNIPCFVNPVSIVPQFQTITTNPIAVNLIPQVDNVFNVGQAGFRYANGYFTNLTVTNSFAFSSLTVNGPTQLNGTLNVTGLSTLAALTTSGLLTASAGVALSGGGSFAGTYTGTPTLSNLWTFSAGITSNALSTFNVGITSTGPNTLNGGGTLTGTWGGTPTWTGLHTFNGGLTSGGASNFLGSSTFSSTATMNGTNLAFSEAGVVVGAGGFDSCQGASSTHTLMCSYNSGTAFPMTQTIGSGTAVMTTAAIAAGACGTTVTVAATGVLTTDSIAFSFTAPPAANPAEIPISSWPTANNVNFQYCIPLGATGVTPNASTLNWRVVR